MKVCHPWAPALILLLCASALASGSGDLREVRLSGGERQQSGSRASADQEHHSRRPLQQGAVRPPKLDWPIWWFAPFWSTSGYGTEAISYVLSLLRSDLVRGDDIWITQHGDNPTAVVVDTMDAADREDLQSLELGMMNTTRSPIILCHSMPPGWAMSPSQQRGANACPPDPAVFRHAYLIGRTMFETDRLPPKFVVKCNAMHEVWVPSEFARRTFVEAGVQPSRIVVLPQGVNTSRYDPALYQPASLPRGQLVFGSLSDASTISQEIDDLPEQPLGGAAAVAASVGGFAPGVAGAAGRATGRAASRAGRRTAAATAADGVIDGAAALASWQAPRTRPYRFLSVFKWETRKGWDILLEAYLTEFTGRDDVELYIVTRPFAGSGNFSTTMHDWASRTLGPRLGLPAGTAIDPRTLPRIYVLQNHISDRLYPMLYKACDVFVLPTRGEGWGRPHVEAMSMGLPIISTNWSGITAYLDPEVGYPLHVETLVEINDTRMEWFHGHRWAQPSTSHLRVLLRHVFTHRDEGRRRGAAARRRMVERFSPAVLAKQVLRELRRIQRIIPHLPGGVDDGSAAGAGVDPGGIEVLKHSRTN